MGERIGASIQFGGKLPRSKVEELMDLLNAEGLKADWNDDPAPHNLGCDFGDGEVNYGNLDELKQFAAENSLSYEYWCDSGSEWMAQTEVYLAETGTSFDFIGGNGEQLFLSGEFIRTLGSYEAVLNYFDRSKELPPFEIVEDEQEPADGPEQVSDPPAD